ncbi:glutamate--cysteine ligase family protein [Oceanicola granulosus HTCC2516]|uniref:Putative glutamate--cysteine ligase 2 n=1 Tax=Oceanicola granulosus (strain ATCC BAA-861 / DSM 15982 / KCTC 12143 / HTCC2516) TaxID=314256 RepID=Q2CA19_OCEGH|nr:carboxylate-amine ligase [Oceanicola granulosus]EAR49518.1 glutamate--cysteine ligase family protein [Oceanicola granulosus HTCC2516]
MQDPDFTLGVEEEYLLVDRESLALREAPEGLLEACQARLGDQVSPEYMQCQIEIGTGVCATIAEARDDLRRLRSCISEEAAKFGMSPIAASCHPLADWKQQLNTDRQRYNQLRDDLGGVVRRMLICGMHVHVGLNDDTLRADLLGQMAYFLPHLLALSASSPFWQGEDTGLASYRISVFDNLPRTGLPPRFDSWEEYERSVAALIDLDLIEDSSKIWWDLRPSHQFPTLESRICDVQPLLSHTVALAALTQCIARMLWRLRRLNQRWRRYENFLIAENRWRAQRYGTGGGLIDFGRHEIVPVPALLEELIELVAEDADALGCTEEIASARRIIEGGTSSERQRAVADAAREGGADRDGQMRAVVQSLIDEFHADL